MDIEAGRTFSFAKELVAPPGCTVSSKLARPDGAPLGFALAAGTDISAESYATPKLVLVQGGSLELYASGGEATTLRAGELAVTPVDVPVGVRTGVGCGYVEVNVGREARMNEVLKAGEVLRLADLLPYQDGSIVNMDLAHNAGMKLALMSFDAGQGLSEHSSPGEAIVFALDGEATIGYEGEEHLIHAGENFKFDAGGRHYVRADKRFKMALLLTLGE